MPEYRALSKQEVKALWRSPRSTKTHCINGHKLTAKIVQVNAAGKYLQRRCRVCAQERDRLRYRNTPGRREMVIASAKAAQR